MNASRRDFLKVSAGLAAHGPVAGDMRLSLSVRVAEAFDNKEKVTMTADELIALAKAHGFAAICMRASLAGIQTPHQQVAGIRRKIDRAGLVVSMVTGDFAVPSNNEHGPDGLRRIGPYLDLAEAFGASLIRICMKKDEDIPWAQRASDQARERRIRLAHQSHCSSPFETVDGSLRVLRAVNRPNFGIIYEPANWMISGQDYGRNTIRKLQPWLFNAYLQNHRLTPDGKAAVDTWTRGRVRLDHIGIWERGGVDVEEMLAGLRAIDYRGYITIHQAFAGTMPVAEAVRRSADYLKQLGVRG